eukprot:3853986-Amphidinium_carterae.1
MQHLRFSTSSPNEVSERKEGGRKEILLLRVQRRPSTRKTLYGVGGNSPEIHESAVIYITVDAVSVRGQQLMKIPITFTVDVLSQSS